MHSVSLKHALWGNAAFSTSCAVVLLGITQPLAQLIGQVPNQILLVLGIGLLGFAAQLVWVAAGKPIRKNLATAITAADVAWVVATPLVLALFPQYFSTTGVVIMVAVATVVGLCAVLQYRALQRLE